jgi:hypothetical protein
MMWSGAAQRSELAKTLGLGQIRRDRAAAARLAAESASERRAAAARSRRIWPSPRVLASSERWAA